VEEKQKSVWARSTLLRILCYSTASSILVCLIMELVWSFGGANHSLEAHLHELAVIACGIFWCTFAIVGTVLGLRHASREVGVIAVGLFLLLSIALVIFVVPVAECPNCTGPPEKQAEGTHGVIIDGKYVTTGCWGCSGRRLTLYRKWTWRGPETTSSP